MEMRARFERRDLKKKGVFGEGLSLRYIYVDEAGTSEREPVTIVAGIIVEADTQFVPAEKELDALKKDYVPTSMQEKFISHATTIWGSQRIREAWQFEERLAYLLGIMSLPRRLGIPLSFGLVRRTAPMPPDFNLNLLSPAQFHHTLAFSGAVSRADKYIRDYGRPEEVATLVVENIPEMHSFLRKIVNGLRSEPITLSDPDDFILTGAELGLGVLLQEGVFGIERIRDGVHFQEKGESPFLQIADACAFGLRRYFAGQSSGDIFAEAILGHQPQGVEWEGPSSYTTYMWHPRRLNPRPLPPGYTP
jgi:hypothetical protein